MDSSINDNFSRRLFSFLCQVIGSEKEVHSRRIFFKVWDDLGRLRKYPKTYVISGSKAEGLNMSGSDLDIMIVINTYPVFHDISIFDIVVGYVSDTEHAPPGFVLLKINPYDWCIFATMSEYGLLVSSDKFKDFLLTLCQKEDGQGWIIHGPCISTKEIDNAFCLKSETWPAIAARWLNRPRYSGWPTSGVVDMLSKEGLLYVPIGSKFGATKSNPLQWRISFSIQERTLVHSFNHTQLLCYALLKLILKEVTNTKSQISNLLCSYFMKTTVFWLSEEIQISEWTAVTLFKCFRACLKRLIYWVRLKYCPNYFIAENNMFEGKMYGRKQQDLLSVLEDLYSRGIHFITKLPTFAHFILGGDCTYNDVEKNDVDVALYPLLHLLLRNRIRVLNPWDFISTSLANIRNGTSNLHKSLCVKWMTRFYIQLLTEMPYESNCENRYRYQQYKQSRFIALMGKHFDIVSGWLWFASFLYQHADYYSALAVTSSILSECTPDKMFITLDALEYVNRDILSSKQSTFLSRHKIFCIYQLNQTLRAGSVLHNADLGNDIESDICAPPIVFLYFLQFLCFHRLGNIPEREQCIRDIELTIENEFFVSSKNQRLTSYAYLIKALQISNSSFFPRIYNVYWKIFRELCSIRDYSGNL